MASWIVGDLHGCAEELSALLDRLAFGADDRLVCCGDLFHRGPDPVGVLELLRTADAQFVLGNHERTVLKRVGLAPARLDGSDRPPLRSDFPPIDAEDLAGDGGLVCHVPAERRAELLVFLQGHRGYSLTNAQLDGAGPTADGRPWRVVHAGFDPARPADEATPHELTRTRRLERRGHPWWYESWSGPELVLFGHTSSDAPRAHSRGGRLVALGLDTGCVYGGALSAYSPELDELVQVGARRRYAAA